MLKSIYRIDEYGSHAAYVRRSGDKAVGEFGAHLRIVQKGDDLVGGEFEGVVSSRPFEHEYTHCKLQSEAPNYWSPFNL